jgi:hypothetical protein
MSADLHTPRGTFSITFQRGPFPVLLTTPKGAKLQFLTEADAAAYIRSVR